MNETHYDQCPFETPTDPAPVAPAKARTVLLVDGNNLAHRAFFGFGRGDDANPLVVGFCVMLGTIVKNNSTPDRRPEVQVFFDGKGRLARTDIDPGYKACLLYTSPSPRDRG